MAGLRERLNHASLRPAQEQARGQPNLSGQILNMGHLSKKQEYLIRELWILAWNASVQRASLYNASVRRNRAPDKRIEDFKSAIIRFVTSRLLLHYVEECTEEQHFKNIAALIQFANQIGGEVLGKAGCKYGIAQKLLNLMLKYLWCADMISAPPHCPVDRIVIDKTQYRGKVNWTEIREESQYREVIAAIKALSKTHQMSVPEWELNFYSRRS